MPSVCPPPASPSPPPCQCVQPLLTLPLPPTGGVHESIKTKQIDAHTHEYIYHPKKEGRYIVMVTYGGQEITKSPFEVGREGDGCEDGRGVDGKDGKCLG